MVTRVDRWHLLYTFDAYLRSVNRLRHKYTFPLKNQTFWYCEHIDTCCCSVPALFITVQQSITKLEMWANAQRDGRPVEYRWRPLFNAAKSGWCPLLECRAVTLQRRKTRWNLQGCPKLANRSQPLVGRSSPYYQDMWRRYCCLTSFYLLSIYALVPKI